MRKIGRKSQLNAARLKRRNTGRITDFFFTPSTLFFVSTLFPILDLLLLQWLVDDPVASDAAVIVA